MSAQQKKVMSFKDMNKHVTPPPPKTRISAVSHYSAFSGLPAMRVRVPVGVRCFLPVYREHHLLYAPLDLVLRLQVSHALRRLAADGQDHVADAQVGLSGFTRRGHLHRRQESHLKVVLKRAHRK